MIMQNLGVTKKYYGMLWYFLEWTMVQLETHVPFSQGRNVMYEELSSWSRKSWVENCA